MVPPRLTTGLLLLMILAETCTAAPAVITPVPSVLDAALVDGENLYLFSGDVVIQVSQKYKSEGRLVDKRTLWSGLDQRVNAAVNYTLDGSTYFFTGTECRVFKNNVLSGPQKIPDDWPDIFRNGGVDAAGNKDGKSYFFKGCSFWTPYERIASDVHLIHELSTINLPCGIDAAWEDDHHLVVSKGSQYWIWGDTVMGPFPLHNLLNLCTWNLNTSSSVAAGKLPNPLVCNGDSRLCSLPIDKVTLPGSHNAGSGFAGPFVFPPCFYQNHELSILEQLRFGIRYLDVDSCWSECGNNLGTCHAGNCAGLLCAFLLQIKTFLLENPTEIVMVNFNHDMTDNDIVIPELVRQIEEQLSPFLNSHFRETGQWPTLEQSIRSGKRLFVIITTQVNKLSFYPQKLWIIDEAHLGSTYDLIIVLKDCISIVNSTRDKCAKLTTSDLIEVSVFGGFGECVDDMMARCDNFLFDSLDACSDYRIQAGKAPNVLMVDYPKITPPHRNVLAAVRQQNARNLLAFNKNCRVRLDAATTLTEDRNTVFFSGNRVIQYSDKDKAEKSSDLTSSINPQLPVNVDSAISGRYWGSYDDTFFFKGCDYWILHNGSAVSGPFVINDTFPGLPCDLDAAVGMDNTAYFLKGCSYWTYKRYWHVEGPSPIDYFFDGLPCNIDAAFNLDDNVYFFKNNNKSGSYWIFSDMELTNGTDFLDWKIDPVFCEN